LPGFGISGFAAEPSSPKPVTNFEVAFAHGRAVTTIMTRSASVIPIRANIAPSSFMPRPRGIRGTGSSSSGGALTI